MLNCEASRYGKDDDLWFREAQAFAQVQFSDKRSEISFVFAVLVTVRLQGLLTTAKIFLLFALVQIVYFFYLPER